jgi:hypothetical protein
MGKPTYSTSKGDDIATADDVVLADGRVITLPRTTLAAAEALPAEERAAERGATAYDVQTQEESIVPCEEPWRPADYLPLPPCAPLPQPADERQK